MPTLELLAAQARELAGELLSTDACPCTEERHKNQSCVTAEEERELTKVEKENGWARRPFYAYNPARMCDGCAAYWFASMAANTLSDLKARQARLAASPK